MNETLVSVHHVYKKFCKGFKYIMLHGTTDLARDFCRLPINSEALRQGEFWALSDVSLELRRGETLGLIGPNGSGKSTLLKLINGIYNPDNGYIDVDARIGALIEVGAGFHPMLTGRENIYVNGSILGLTNREIADRFDEIVEFAGIESFIDTPVKHYSSGMYIRLGFAVAVFAEPDVLLVDEVLAVGDHAFQMKCYQKIHELKLKGVSIILVAHNPYTILEHTTKAIYLNQGIFKYSGEVEPAVNQYLTDTLTAIPADPVTDEFDELPIGGISESGKVELKEIAFLNAKNETVNTVKSGQMLVIKLKMIFHEYVEKPIVSVNFYGLGGFKYGLNSAYEKQDLTGLTETGELFIKIKEFHVPVGSYACSVVIFDGNLTNLILWHDKRYQLVVTRPPRARGSLRLPVDWEVGV